MFRDRARLELGQELTRAKKARQEGYEGRARVYARRAAGVAIREFLALRGISAPAASAYELLVYLLEASDISDNVRKAAQHLTMQVSKDFDLPAEVDLVDEARRLAQALEAELKENK